MSKFQNNSLATPISPTLVLEDPSKLYSFAQNEASRIAEGFARPPMVSDSVSMPTNSRQNSQQALGGVRTSTNASHPFALRRRNGAGSRLSQQNLNASTSSKKDDSSIEHYAAEKKRWQNIIDILRKPPQDRSDDDLQDAYDVLHKLKFFDNIPDEQALMALRFFRYVKFPRQLPVIDMNEVRSYNSIPGIEPANPTVSSLKQNRYKSKSHQKSVDTARAGSQRGSLAIGGKSGSQASLFGSDRSDVVRLMPKFYVILNGTVSVSNFAHQTGAAARKALSSRNSGTGLADETASQSNAGFEQLIEERNSSRLQTAITTERDANMASAAHEVDAGSGKKLCQLSRGDSFGEVNVNRALERDGGRYMWITREETELIELDMDKYRLYLMNYHEREIEDRVIFLRSLVVPLFTDYPEPLLYELAKALVKKVCPHQMTIIKQDEPGNRMFFLRRGEVTVLKHIEVTEMSKGLGAATDQMQTSVKYIQVAYLKPREYFGEVSLLTNDVRATSIFCSSNVELLVMSKIDFTRLMSKAAIDKMKEYAQGYPTENEIRKVYLKQRKWETYKKQVMEEECLIHLGNDLNNAQDEEFIQKRRLQNARSRLRKDALLTPRKSAAIAAAAAGTAPAAGSADQANATNAIK